MAWSFNRFSYIFALTFEKTGCLVHYTGINVHTYRHLLVTKLGICYATCPCTCNMYYFEIHVLVYCLFLLHHLSQEASYSCTWSKIESLLFSFNCIFLILLEPASSPDIGHSWIILVFLLTKDILKNYYLLLDLSQSTSCTLYTPLLRLLFEASTLQGSILSRSLL